MRNIWLAIAIAMVVVVGACRPQPKAEVAVKSPEQVRLEQTVTFDTTSIAAAVRLDSIEGFAAIDSIEAKAWMLVDDSTGIIISARNAHQRRYMASLTKMMTGLLALEHGHLSDTIKITRDVFVHKNSHVRPGEAYVARDLLYLMMLISDNDAAHAIAKAVAGDTLRFYGKMNRKARYLCMSRTNFASPNGMPNDSNYSCAADLVKLARYCMRDSAFAAIVRTAEKDIPLIDGRHRVCPNTNLLLRGYGGCTGIKTGFTRQAEACLAAQATRGGHTLTLVLLGSPTYEQLFAEAAALLDYGFNVMRAYDRNAPLKPRG